MKFLFDLDGTVTSVETLPVISEHFGCTEQILELTAKTVQGNVPFVESFIRRVNILGDYSVNEISDLLAKVPLYDNIAKFIDDHKEDCIIVTGNLTCWCEGLFKKIGCKCYGSEAECVNDKVIKLKSILRKEQIVEQYKSLGETVVFIGDGNNDLEAMRQANVSIAVGLTHNPAQSLMSICDYIIFNENALVRQLRQLCGEFGNSKSVVISCAGIGSRLGLGLTKALVQINGGSLISWQLKLFRDVEDLRLVIGFQASEIIEEVRRFRDDIIFCYNHRYFETKTGASYFLGARHANRETLEWDGDLLVHPDDVRMILATPGEFICYGDKSSEDTVFVHTNEHGEVTSFSRESGDFEWTGPACMDKKHLMYCSQNVFNMFEPLCPLRGIKVRAYDIDTYNDYVRVAEITKDWKI
ncbi:HAD-IB family phosphatase [Phocaeicola dorei]|uniref:HAD-IB family phosphatase n=1 Tax=Phocaeicola dorei TaxID=357276 RepID=UPI001875F75C|nr:HAD-IB family phosphatase [Phocaeicola dorei]MBE5079635.1 HAD-IB family phosphatase [Phocaeicola dorei]